MKIVLVLPKRVGYCDCTVETETTSRQLNMIITKVTPRKDGKYLVALHFSHGANLRKIVTAEELQAFRKRVEDDRIQEANYRAQVTTPKAQSV